MENIKVGFSRPRAWFVPFSWLIRLFDGTPYSHVYIRLYSAKYGRWMIYQASHTFVNFYGQAAFDAEAIVLKEFDVEISDETKTKIMQFAIENAGVKYDIKTVMGIAVVKIAALFGRNIKNPMGNSAGFFCAEIVALILIEIMGKDLKGDPSTMTPKVIFGYLESSIP